VAKGVEGSLTNIKDRVCVCCCVCSGVREREGV